MFDDPPHPKAGRKRKEPEVQPVATGPGPDPTPPPPPPEPAPPPKGQPAGMEIVLTEKEWEILTSEDPMAVRELRHRPRLNVREDFPLGRLGPVHSVLKNQPPCARCACPSFFVIADGVACLGCGTSRSE